MYNKKDFLQRKEDILNYFTRYEPNRENISEYCSLSGIPITVVCEFLIERYPKNKKLYVTIIRDVNKFFGIKESTCGSCQNRCYNKHCILED